MMCEKSLVNLEQRVDDLPSSPCLKFPEASEHKTQRLTCRERSMHCSVRLPLSQSDHLHALQLQASSSSWRY